MNRNTWLMKEDHPEAAPLRPISLKPPAVLAGDLRDWAGEATLVSWILEVVSEFISDHHLIPGSRLFEPTPPLPTMLSVLAYCYITGRYASDDIEAAGVTDPAVRYLCANHFLTSGAIRRFRRVHRGLLRFCVQGLCRRAWQHRFGLTGARADPTGDTSYPESRRGTALGCLLAAAAEERIQQAILADTMALDV